LGKQVSDQDKSKEAPDSANVVFDKLFTRWGLICGTGIVVAGGQEQQDRNATKRGIRNINLGVPPR
jgi:hypothetical protein